MRSALACTVLATAALIGPTAGVAAASSSSNGPSSARIAKAIFRAQHSKNLWATVNVCAAGGKGGDLGIRGQMPTLGFASTLSMTIQVNLYSPTAKRFVALKYSTARTTVTPGSFSTGLQQDGAVFPFSSKAGLLDASVTFVWSRDGEVLGTALRQTTAGHHTADFAKPPHYSAAQCRIG